MSALNATGIRERLAYPDAARRLVVTPILDPCIQLGANQAGIDVRLGRVFSIVRPWSHGVGELLDNQHDASSTSIDTFVLAFGQPLIVHPHQFVLARTLEIVRLPPDLLAYVIGRSSWGRRGLIVATAVVVHPGFAGPITLELRNLGETPIALYPMDRIAQLTFHDLSGSEDITSTASQFTASFEPSLGRVRNQDEVRRLRRLAVEAEPAAGSAVAKSAARDV